MKVLNKRYVKYAVAGVLAAGLISIPVKAAFIATEQQIAGANVVVDEYCQSVASGVVQETSVETEPAPEQTPAQPEVTPAPQPEDDNDGHVKLNLNYDRLGIASKVDTYLNVRKKPSESAKIVGKMTKNAGCHIYKIKKGWAKIVSGKVDGWVKSSYIVTDSKAEELATKVGRECVEINTNSLRVRALPTTSAPIYSVVSEEEEFVIRKKHLTMDFVNKMIKQQKISKEAIERAGGMEAIQADLDNWICITVDDEHAFVAKEYVTEQYSLKRAVKVGTVSAGGSDGVSSSQASIAEYAKQFLGNPYVWGGSSLTGGADCSGFTMSLYRKYGHSLPHNAAAQAGVTRSVSSPKPGDLFFYSNGSRINHVAMYIGSGLVIHASNPSDGIKISNAYYRKPVKIGRVMN
ncbi:MAG: SH3 domain-containing protein [Eubacterium sp.]|jgi:cell wall-associated NlpC family hydrolase|nr:SH3 domain-containing protein [Eubacterium sp.]